MDKMLKPLITLATLVAMLVAGLSYFATQKDLEVVAATVQANSDQLNYQSSLRQYEFLLSLYKQDLTNEEVKQRLDESYKRVRYYECKLFGQGCE